MRNAALCAAFLTGTVAPAQWYFELDTTFRTEIQYRYVNSILPIEAGGVIASGVMRFPGEYSDKRLVRLTNDGVRDESFNNSGLGGARIMSWQNGIFYAQPSATVRRILPTGYQDPTFIELNSGPYFLSSTGGTYHVFPDGRILLSGSHILSDSIRGFEGYYELIWFTNTGYLDTTRTHRNANGPIYEFKELPNGQFICTCNCTQYEGQPVSKLFRVHADGALDTGFQSDVSNGNIYEFEAIPDGRVLVGGNYRRNVVPQDTIRLARFFADGSFDPSFGPLDFDGNPAWWPWFGTQVFDIFPFTADRYIIAGQFTSVNGQPRSGLCMIDTSGQLMPELEDFYVGPFTYQTTTNAGFTNVYWNQDSTALYVCGTYVGCNDGNTNDTLQRFVSRLLVEDLGMSLAEHEYTTPHFFSLQPNPARTWVTFTYDQSPGEAGLGKIVVRDLIGRQVVELMMNGPQGQTVWDTRYAAPGTYLVQYVWNGRLAHSEKLILQQ